MKKLLIFLLTACLLTACGNDADTPETKAPLPAPTEAAAAVTEAPGQINTVVLLKSDTQFVSYALTALNPYGVYPEEAAINAQGAEALAKWLLGQTALDAAAAYREGLFLPAADAPVYSGWISKAAESTKAVRLMTTVDVAEAGLLDALLPIFAEEFGYEVEILSAKEEEVYLRAAMGEADLVLAPAPREGEVFGESDNFRKLPGFSEIHIPLLRCPYVLCGPMDDPAGVGEIVDAHVSLTDGKLRGALRAIAEAECYFISRGDGSDAHLAEQSLWLETPEGDWYFAADTDMGPCLTIAEEMGGYVLCDGLTYELFRSVNGIIS